MTVQIRKDSRGKRPDFYDAEGLDQAMSMILVLASEFSTMRDRLDTVERICADKGIMLEDEIEAYTPDEAVLTAREVRRQEFLQRLYYLARKDAAEQSENDTAERYSKTLEDIAKG